jgi:H+/Cl- antiporter ClcA
MYYVYVVLRHKMLTPSEMASSLRSSLVEAGLLAVPAFGVYWMLESANASTLVKILVLGFTMGLWGVYVLRSLKKSGLNKKKKKADPQAEEEAERAALPTEPLDLDG